MKCMEYLCILNSGRLFSTNVHFKYKTLEIFQTVETEEMSNKKSTINVETEEERNM